MKNCKKIKIPDYTLGEEIVNAITHGLGAIFGIVALTVLLIKNNYNNLISSLCFSVYGSSLIILYTASTLYHALKVSRAKAIFRKLDHCSIFLLIAGTYTPISGLLIGGVTGIIVLACIWATAILGVVLNAINVNKFAKFSFACYLLMGWSVVFVIKPLIQVLSGLQALWLIIGGAAYTLGAILYLLGKKAKYIHGVWHLFVLLGSVSHFIIFIV